MMQSGLYNMKTRALNIPHIPKTLESQGQEIQENEVLIFLCGYVLIHTEANTHEGGLES
jgi:hypothetical protein